MINAINKAMKQVQKNIQTRYKDKNGVRGITHERAHSEFKIPHLPTIAEVLQFFSSSARDAPSDLWLEENGYPTPYPYHFPVADSSFAPVPFACDFPLTSWCTPSTETDVDENGKIVETKASFCSYHWFDLYDIPQGYAFGRITCTGTRWVFRVPFQNEKHLFFGGTWHYLAWVGRPEEDNRAPKWAQEWIHTFKR